MPVEHVDQSSDVHQNRSERLPSTVGQVKLGHGGQPATKDLCDSAKVASVVWPLSQSQKAPVALSLLRFELACRFLAE